MAFTFWSGLLDSNQRPRAPQTCALPTALNPDPCLNCGCKGKQFFGNDKIFRLFFSKMLHNCVIIAKDKTKELKSLEKRSRYKVKVLSLQIGRPPRPSTWEPPPHPPTPGFTVCRGKTTHTRGGYSFFSNR